MIKSNTIFSFGLIAIVFFINITEGISQKELNADRVDSIWSYNYNLGSQLRSLMDYNSIVKYLGLSDTVKIIEVDNEFIYYYREQEIEDLHFESTNNSPFKLRYSKSHNLTYISAYVKRSASESCSIMVTGNSECSWYIRLETYHEDVLWGEYIEKCLDGEIYVQGNYDQIDSVYQDTIILIDYNTYEEEISIKKRTKIEVKCGTWFLRKNGEAIIEEYAPCEEIGNKK